MTAPTHPLLIAALIIAAPASLLAQTPPGAGDLDPSIANGALDGGGAPQPSMKSVDTIDPGTPLIPANAPFVIDAPGHYYLTGNIDTLAPDTVPITVNENNVTIDLRGFAIIDSGAVAGNKAAIQVVGPQHHLVVRNGSIEGAWKSGLDGAFCANSKCEDLRVVGIQDYGIRLDRGAQIRGCHVEGASGGGAGAQAGIDTGPSSLVHGCVVQHCDGPGIKVSGRTTVSSCVATDNGSTGIIIAAGGYSVIRDCVAAGNSGSGFFANVASEVASCSSYLNSGDGFVANIGCSLTGCVASENSGEGFALDGRCVINRCVAENNTLSGIDGGIGGNILSLSSANENGSFGFNCGGGSRVTACLALNNTDDGFVAGVRTTFTNCASSSNGSGGGSPDADGFELVASSTVVGCRADSNASAGIRALSDKNHLEGNHLNTNGAEGIALTVSNNTVIRNSLYDNTAGAISHSGGNIGPLESASLGTSPHANFE